MLFTIEAKLSGMDLGFLLHKHPERVHTFELPFGKAQVFYPEAGAERALAALLVDVDPVALVRGSGREGSEGTLDQYVNDRPYAASSFLCVAMSRVFGTAMSGKSKERQSLADLPCEWTATLSAVPCRGGEELLRELFEPLGYEVTAKQHPLDEKFPEWGPGYYYSVTLRGTVLLKDLLSHIYVLVPVLDAEKHYWVGNDEVEKLIRKGEGWLAQHPHKEEISARYLRYDRTLTRQALQRLMEESGEESEATESRHQEDEQKLEKPLRLWEQRIGAVLSALRAGGAKSVADLGCGEGRFLEALLAERGFERILGMDVSWRNLESARRRLRLERMPAAQRERMELIHGSLLYRDKRLAGFDAAIVIEVIEHMDAARLAALERVVFECAQPRMVVVTTPNAEYNARFETLPSGKFRHSDHRFEWSRAEFEHWAGGIAERFGYSVRYSPVGDTDAELGAPTQMGVFSK
ncbi:MAG: 3' terminal RNA ribose 2'-O-methyltransferase Hen1 [Acidobacteria bacterium]|nr:3' terminal RNA ribose 2'-O-methyltransferase Hen1 [Acidobacteriota bacterium]